MIELEAYVHNLQKPKGIYLYYWADGHYITRKEHVEHILIHYVNNVKTLMAIHKDTVAHSINTKSWYIAHSLV